MSKFQAPKGVSEYFPPNSDQFEYVRDHLLTAAKLAGYSLIELPVFEDTEVFTRGVGNQRMLLVKRCIPLKIGVADQSHYDLREQQV